MDSLPDHEILQRLITHARRQMTDIRFAKFSVKLEDLLRVSTELMLTVLAHADAVEALLARRHVTATAPLERAAWEVSQDREFLIRRENAFEDATRARIHALLEISEHAARSSGSSTTLGDEVGAELDNLETKAPHLVKEMRALRTKNKGLHWSGVTRTQVYAPGESSRSAYKLLSWESHPFSGGLHAIDIIPIGTGVRVVMRATEDVEELSDRTAWAVAHSVLFAWNAYATLWHLQPVEAPWDA